MSPILTRLIGSLLVLTAQANWAFSQQGPPASPEEYFLEMPTPLQLFRIQSEHSVRVEIREKGKQKGAKDVQFPPDALAAPKIVDLICVPPAQMVMLPPARICFHPLYFQDKRTERDVKSTGIIEPLRSTIHFYGKVIALPGLMVAVPPWRMQCWNYPFYPNSLFDQCPAH